MPERAQQRVQRRHRVARRRLLPREARRVRGLRRAPQLRRQHQPRPPSVIPLTLDATKHYSDHTQILHQDVNIIIPMPLATKALASIQTNLRFT